jgi:hypothetical protein
MTDKVVWQGHILGAQPRIRIGPSVQDGGV